MKKVKEYVVIAMIFAILTILILMQSTVHPMAKLETDIDSSVFIYGSNMIRNGKVLYRDFFDHKGPSMYIIDVIGLSLADGNLVGIWIIEIIFMMANLFIMYKISGQFSKNKIINVISTIISIIPICRFINGGNQAEEYALTFILYAFYVFIKYLKNRKVTYIEIALNGFCLSIVMFFKMNLISLWIIFVPVVIFMFIKEKKYKELLKTILAFLAGMLIVILPLVIYFIANNAFGDFLYCVLEFNIKYAGHKEQGVGLIETIKAFTVSYSKLCIAVLVIFISNIVRLKINRQKISEQVILLFYYILTFILIVITERNYCYYGMILIPCFIIPITEALDYILNIKNIKRKIITLIIFLILISLCLVDNVTWQIEKIKDSFNSVINNELVNYIKENTKEEDSILVLWNMCEYYNYTGRHYDGKYMYQSPIILVDDKIYEEIIEELAGNKPKMIIYGKSYEKFKKIKYSYDEYIEVAKQEHPEFFEYKSTIELLEKYIISYTEKINNISKLFREVDKMEKEGIYRRVEGDLYVVWQLVED